MEVRLVMELRLVDFLSAGCAELKVELMMVPRLGCGMTKGRGSRSGCTAGRW